MIKAILSRIETLMIIRRANQKFKKIAAERKAIAMLNRPHQQSKHLVGWFIPNKGS